MERLFDLESMIAGMVANELERTMAFDLWLTLIYGLVVILGFLVMSAVGQRLQRGPDASPVGPAGHALSVIPVTIFYLVLFWLLTGRFIFEYLLLSAGIVIVSQIYFVVVDSLAGINDETKREKVHVMSYVHVNVTAGSITLGLVFLNLLVLIVAFAMALLASFRLDLTTEDMQARISIFLFAVPAVSGFILFLPFMLSVLLNRLTDQEVRGFYLARLLPITLITSIMLVFPSFLFGDLPRQYAPFLPRLSDLGLLPLTLFGVFGLLPFLYSTFVHSALVGSRYQWRRKWLRDLSEALDNDARAARQYQSLMDEICRMVRRSPYFENYIVTLIHDHHVDDEEKQQSLFSQFEMKSRSFDDMQIGMIDRHKTDLPNWDRLTAYVDDLFLYFFTLEQDGLTQEKIALWQRNAEDVSQGTLRPNSLIAPVVGGLVTLVSGPVMERIIPFIEQALNQILE